MPVFQTDPYSGRFRVSGFEQSSCEQPNSCQEIEAPFVDEGAEGKQSTTFP